MGKPKLVISKNSKDVYLNGVVVGRVIKFYTIGINIVRMEIFKIDNLSDVDIDSIHNHQDNYISSISAFISTKKIGDYLWLKKSIVIIRDASDSLLPYVEIKIDYKKWNMKFHLISFLNKLESNCNPENNFIRFKYKFNQSVCIVSVSIALNDLISNTKDYFYSIFNIFKIEFNKSITKLLEEEKFKPQNLYNTFTFPPEIQNSCEQYLQYFVQFLKDIGINAETNIESKAHETLFTVIPKDGEEALDKIREALDMYLSLPQNPEFETVVAEFPDLGVQQLASQVYFLKSQLVMLNATLQMKDATIKSLQLTNYQQKTVIDSQQTKAKNEEEIAGGLAKVKEVDLKIISINLPELLRRIKRTFK